MSVTTARAITTARLKVSIVKRKVGSRPSKARLAEDEIVVEKKGTVVGL
jgi:hypothetical protein